MSVDRAIRVEHLEDERLADYRFLRDRDLRRREEGLFVGDQLLVVEQMLQRPELTRSVLVAEPFGVFNHTIDLCVGQAAGGDDLHRLFASGGLVLRRDVQDAVGVDVKRHLDLGDATRRGRDAVEDELAQALVVSRHRPLALEHVDLNLRLPVRSRGENLTLARGDGSIALDQRSRHAAERFDTERQRSHVQQQDILDLATEHTCLDCCP